MVLIDLTFDGIAWGDGLRLVIGVRLGWMTLERYCIRPFAIDNPRID
jgi:hypothetical protein